MDVYQIKPRYLSLREGVDSVFLCYKVEGFGLLWEDLVGGDVSWISMENKIYLDVFGEISPCARLEVLECAEDIRNEILSLLPCAMHVSRLENIIKRNIHKNLQEYI